MMNSDMTDKNNTSTEEVGGKGEISISKYIQTHFFIAAVLTILFIFSRVTGLSAVCAADSDSLCLWLARAPVQSNHPRALAFPNAWEERVLVTGEGELLTNVFQRLTNEGFMGCPVVDSIGVYINQIEMLDIVFFVCRLFKARQYTLDTLVRKSKSSLLQLSHVFHSLCRLRR